MLLQTIKSRNLWLWGEIGSLLSEEGSKLLEERDKLEQEKVDISRKLTELYKKNQGTSQEAKDLQEKLAKKKQEIDALQQSTKGGQISDNKEVLYKYTTPFKITALQSVDVTWDNPVGESYGLTANFLQSWHNKPVNINFKGISYMGAFGGQTVGSLSSTGKDINNAEESKLSSKLLHAANALSAGVTTASQAISKFTREQNISGIQSDASIEGKYDSVIDTDVQKINDLLSNYGEGLYPKPNGSPYIYLLMENPGSGSNNNKSNNNKGDSGNDFVTFIGHIKQFTYSERTDKPFLYDYTVHFIGTPTIEDSIRNAKIHAKQDANSVKLTVVASDSGYSLGYGW